jgi:hypothetical protein
MWLEQVYPGKQACGCRARPHPRDRPIDGHAATPFVLEPSIVATRQLVVVDIEAAIEPEAAVERERGNERRGLEGGVPEA